MITGCCNAVRFCDETAGCTTHSVRTGKYFGVRETNFQVKLGSQSNRAHSYVTADRGLWTSQEADTHANFLPVPRSNCSFHTVLFLQYVTSTSMTSYPTLGHLSRNYKHAPVPCKRAVKPWRWLSCYSAPQIKCSQLDDPAGFSIGASFWQESWPVVNAENTWYYLLKARVFRNKLCPWEILKQKEAYVDVYLHDDSRAIEDMTVIDTDLFRPVLIGVILTPTAVTWEKWISVLSGFYQYQLKTNKKKKKEYKPHAFLLPMTQRRKITAKISVFPLLNINHSVTSSIKPFHSH